MPGVYQFSVFALTKLGERCSATPTGYNKFGKPYFGCTPVVRLDARALPADQGTHTLVVYPAATDPAQSQVPDPSTLNLRPRAHEAQFRP